MEDEALTLALGRWLDLPGHGATRRRLGECLRGVRADVTAPPQRRLETPSGDVLAAANFVEGETAIACARRMLPKMRNAVLCGANLTPLDPVVPIGPRATAVVVFMQATNTSDLAEENTLGMLRWMIARGYEWDIFTSWCAAEHGNLKLLQWAIANGCPWHAQTSQAAAYGGHLELLQWVLAHGCEWHLSASSAAARGGHLELMQWALANGCKWSPYTIASAARGNHRHVIRWAIASGYRWTIEEKFEASRQCVPGTVEWIDELVAERRAGRRAERAAVRAVSRAAAE